MVYEWGAVSQFRNREREVGRLEEWWEDPSALPLAMYGRRRVGKSWLLRRLAHGKRAHVLVALQMNASQLAKFAEDLVPEIGFTPAVPDLAALFRVMYQSAAQEKLLIAIDEFPWLLPSRTAQRKASLSAVQAVMEEYRDASQLKLILCGSLIGQMESLMAERAPLRGRLTPLEIQPVRFAAAREYMPKTNGIDEFQRYAIAGGMPLYLNLISGDSLDRAVSKTALNPLGPLWNEPLVVLEQEMNEAKTYFTILLALAYGDKEHGELVAKTKVESSSLSKYLNTLEGMNIVARKLPVGAKTDSRQGHWRLTDNFFRFWFRFVFPFQSDLESGLSPEDLFAAEIAPAIADFTAPVFEEWCRDWTRENRGHIATRVGSWWGRALDQLRRTGERETEEIDVVGLARSRVEVVGEAKWTTRPMSVAVLRDIDEFKLPALRQAGIKVVASPKILLFSKSGYAPALHDAASLRSDVELIDVAAELNAIP